MRFLTMIFCAFLTANLWAQTVPRQAWTVETEDLRMRNLSMIYGETLDLECTFRNYFAPLDIEGASVTLHARTNGMDAAESYQVTGYSEAGGKAVVRVDVDAWLPQGLDSVDYTLAVVRAGTTRILRAFGTVNLRGSSAANNHVPMPMSVYAVLESELTNHIAWAEAKAILWDDASTNKTDTLASVASRGGFAGTEVIAPFAVRAKWYELEPHIAVEGVQNLGVGVQTMANVTGDVNFAVGTYVMQGVEGSANFGFGHGCIKKIWGDGNFAIGNSTFEYLRGNQNIGIGHNVLRMSNVTNCFAIGRSSGYRASGKYKLFMDVASTVLVPADDNALVIDNGQLKLGRGSVFNPNPNLLRGVWKLDDGTQLNQLRGKLDAADGIATNLTIVGAASVAELNINGEPALTASTFLPPFTNMLLFADGGTNYYPRWDQDIGTFIVTGVPQ